MKSFAVLSLLSLGVSGANIAPRQQQRGPPNNRGGRPTGGGTVVFSQLPQTTARTTARIQTTIRITSTLRTSTTARQSAAPAPVCEWTGHCIGDTCQSENDCDLDYVCTNKKCAALPGSGPTSTSTARTTARTSSAAGGARTTTVFVTASRSSSTARGGQVVTTVIVRPTASSTPPSQGGGAPCGDNPIACVGASCRSNADCGYDLILCKSGICSL